MATDKKWPVLIIGGGISGLTAALFLVEQGVIPLVVERHRSTSIHPRARGFDIRTMELFRELGLSEKIREAGKALSSGWGIRTSVSVAEALKKVKRKNGDPLKFPVQMKGLEDLMAQSPEIGARCTQDLSEPVLLEAARERGAEILFHTELVSFEQDERGVTAVIRNRETLVEQTILAGYMIAADGAKSSIRETLLAKTVGAGPLGNLLNIYFRADLGDFVRGREFSLIRIVRPDIKGLLASINNSDRWVFHLHYDAANGAQPEDFTADRLTGILEDVIGLPGTRIQVISMLPWQPTVRVATEMKHGRIFLAGDAAHTMTPYGGKGANSGVQDVHNLGWKLAYVIQGKADPALLETYSPERQPIGLHYAEQSGKMADGYGLIKKVISKFLWAFLSVMIVSFFRLKKLFPGFSMRQLGELMGLPGYKYCSKAIVHEPPEENPGIYTKSGTLKAQTGTRFPHLWVTRHSQKMSTLDLFGKDFVLITGSDNAIWQKAAGEVRASLDIVMPVYSIGKDGDLDYREKSIGTALGIGPSGAIVIRPDGFVAWKCGKQLERPAEVVLKKIRMILAIPENIP